MNLFKRESVLRFHGERLHLLERVRFFLSRLECFADFGSKFVDRDENIADFGPLVDQVTRIQLSPFGLAALRFRKLDDVGVGRDSLAVIAWPRYIMSYAFILLCG